VQSAIAESRKPVKVLRSEGHGMISSGSASDLTEQEAQNLLEKLIAESTRVQAALAIEPGLSASVVGTLRKASNGTIWILASADVDAPHIAFDPASAAQRKYGDRRAFPANAPRMPQICSALVFIFESSTQVALFEITDGS
jgi:hypothetical protein